MSWELVPVWIGAAGLLLLAVIVMPQLPRTAIGRVVLVSGTLLVAVGFLSVGLGLEDAEWPKLARLYVLGAIVWVGLAVYRRRGPLYVESQQTRDERRAVKEALARARESERRRWAQELHDQTLQGLAAAKVLIDSRSRGADDPPILKQVAEILGEEVQSLRALIDELRPPVLEQFGLEPALRSLASNLGERHEVEVHAVVDVNGRLPDALETTVYRMVQEALTNAAKHSGAENVWVEVRANGEVRLTVEDDGVGFDPSMVSRGYGLLNLRERLEVWGGEVEVDSSPGRGTRVKARLPLA